MKMEEGMERTSMNSLGSEASNSATLHHHYSPHDRDRIQSLLTRQLGPEFCSERAGPGATKVLYLEGWKAINLANEVFGFDGWCSQVRDITVDFVDVDPVKGAISLGLSAVVRVTLKDGTFHEDIGYGHIENARSKAAAFEKAKKEAVTDAMKRSLKAFGNILGNCLYDKDFVRKVQRLPAISMKPFDVGQLHRHPDVVIRPSTLPRSSTLPLPIHAPVAASNLPLYNQKTPMAAHPQGLIPSAHPTPTASTLTHSSSAASLIKAESHASTDSFFGSNNEFEGDDDYLIAADLENIDAALLMNQVSPVSAPHPPAIQQGHSCSIKKEQYGPPSFPLNPPRAPSAPTPTTPRFSLNSNHATRPGSTIAASGLGTGDNVINPTVASAPSPPVPQPIPVPTSASASNNFVYRKSPKSSHSGSTVVPPGVAAPLPLPWNASRDGGHSGNPGLKRHRPA